MTVALWIIAVCEVIKVIQYMMQIMITRHQTRLNARAIGKFIQMEEKKE